MPTHTTETIVQAPQQGPGARGSRPHPRARSHRAARSTACPGIRSAPSWPAAGPPLRVVLDGLRRASRDPRVAGAGGQARRVAVAAWRWPGPRSCATRCAELPGQGKLTVAWAETFGEFGRGTVPYYLATAFDEVWLQPSGDVGLTGVAAEVPFLRGALDKAGITPQFAQRHEYKNAANCSPSRTSPSPPGGDSSGSCDSMMEQLVAGIAEGRRLDAAEVRGPGRPGAAVRRRGAGGRAGRPARLPRRGVRRRSADQAGRDEPCSCTWARYRPIQAGRAVASGSRQPRRDADGAGPRDRPHPPRQQRPRSRSRRASAGSDTVCAALRAATDGDDGQGDRAPGGQPGRIVRRVRRHLARGGAGPAGGQAGGRVDGRRGRLGRVLRRDGRRRHRRRARHDHRLDRRLGRQAGGRRAGRAARGRPRGASPGPSTR